MIPTSISPTVATGDPGRIWTTSSSTRLHSPQQTPIRRRISLCRSASIQSSSDFVGRSISNQHKSKTAHDDEKSQIREMFQQAKRLERQGQWRKASSLLNDILALDATDAHSYLALAKLEARRNRIQEAARVFERGTVACPQSIHLWQAWAVHEDSQSQGGPKARELYERAFHIDPYNPYVCHAYGLLERRGQNFQAAQELWERALEKKSTAALVCSLGELWIGQQRYEQARALYDLHVAKLTTRREQVEVYLAYAWLEERYLRNVARARDLLQAALHVDPSSSWAQVALARLEGRRSGGQSNHREAQEEVTLQRLTKDNFIPSTTSTDKAGQQPLKSKKSLAQSTRRIEKTNCHDGRVFNALAKIQVKARKYDKARRILREGLQHYSRDFSLWQAAGKVEERLGNVTGARSCYATSLCIQPSAPTLVAYALLELKHPVEKRVNFSRCQGLFEEALLVDPRHGPAYNSYGNALLKRGQVDAARAIFERGVQANCSDAASVFHGYAKLELSMGNVSRGRQLLQQGLEQARWQHLGMDSPHRDRARFLAHTLGMLELNSDNPLEARRVFMDGLRRYGNSSSQLLLGAAMSEMKLGNEDSARPLYEKAVAVNPRHAQAWQVWGVMEMRAGRWDDAQTLFQCGLRSNPKHGALWLAYATLEGRKGHAQVSRTLFTKGLQHAPNHTPLLQAWASLELRQGNWSAARLLITQALTRDKHNGSGWLVAAEIEKRTGNNGLVLLLLLRGLECAPNCVELYRALGDALLSAGKIQEAREIYERGMDIDPQYATLYHSLAQLEAQVFNLEGLSKLNKKAAIHFQTDKFGGSGMGATAINSQKSEKDRTNRRSNDSDKERRTSADGVLGQKLKMGRSRTRVPPEVTALAQRIVEEEVEENAEARRVRNAATTEDPVAFLECLSSASLMDNELLLGDFLSSLDDDGPCRRRHNKDDLDESSNVQSDA
ncbi:hypothetical protein ACA910_011642 [Epithemia clementina (nom. ined.)]